MVLLYCWVDGLGTWVVSTGQVREVDGWGGSGAWVMGVWVQYRPHWHTSLSTGAASVPLRSFNNAAR